jgi:heme a synthase
VFFPPGMFELEPLWRNFFENPALVQFIHRMAGYLLLVFASSSGCAGAQRPFRDARAFHC